MENRFVLVPEDEETTHGMVRPAEGIVAYGRAVGIWRTSGQDGRIYLDLYSDTDTIIHETATSKGVRAELRAAEKDAKGTERKPTIVLDPRTKRFKEVW